MARPLPARREPPQPPGSSFDMLVVVHGRYPGERIALDRSSVMIGGGPRDDLRLHGLPHRAVRIDSGTHGYTFTRIDRSIEVALDGKTCDEGVLTNMSELWIEDSIVQLLRRHLTDLLERGRREALTDVLGLRDFGALLEHRCSDESEQREAWSIAYLRLAAPALVGTSYRDEATPLPDCLGFRDFRTRHGNVAANRLLRAAARSMSARVPAHVIGRVLGWTFAVFLRKTAAENLDLVEVMRRDIAAVRVDARETTAGLDCIAVVLDGGRERDAAALEQRAFESLDEIEASPLRHAKLVG